MKNYLIALLGIVIMLGSSCSKKAAPITEPVKKSATAGVLQFFTQGYVYDLSPKDSAIHICDTWVYNTTAVILKLDIFDKFKPFYVDENGVSHKANTDVEITKTVPKLTPGKIIAWHFTKSKSGRTIIDSVTGKFDANDRTYYLKFYRTKESQIFHLDPHAQIVYKDKTYKVIITSSQSDESCELVFYGDEKKEAIKINEVARGFNSTATKNDSSIETEQKKDDSSPVKTEQKDKDDYK